MDTLSMISLDSLDDVKRYFAKWRATRPNKGRIPNHLWDKVLGILDYYPIGEVTKELGLSGSQVSSKRKQRIASELNLQKSANPSFVELNISQPKPSNKPVASQHGKIEIRRPDGAVLIIDQLPEQTMLQVLNQFTQAEK